LIIPLTRPTATLSQREREIKNGSSPPPEADRQKERG